MKKFINNFTSGEWTPMLDRRIDYERYDTACRKIENFNVLPYGGAQYRPGFDFVSPVLSNGSPPRIIPFVFSVTDKNLLILSRFGGDTYLSVVSESGGTLFQVKTPYGTDDYFKVQYKQINDVIWMTHPNHPIQKVVRGVAGWSMSEIEYVYPPFLDENTQDESLIWFVRDQDEGGGHMLSGSISSNNMTFNRGHVGSYWQISQKNRSDSIDLALTVGTTGQATYIKSEIISYAWVSIIRPRPGQNPEAVGYWSVKYGNTEIVSEDEYNALLPGAYSDFSNNANPPGETSYVLSTSQNAVSYSKEVPVSGDWQASTNGYWWGRLTLQRSDDGGVSWEAIRVWENKSDRNVSASGSVSYSSSDGAAIKLLRFEYVYYGAPFAPEIWNGDAPDSYANAYARLDLTDSMIDGVVRITALIDADGNETNDDSQNARVTVIRDLLFDGSNQFEDNSTNVWREGAWSGHRGYPSAIGLYEQRLFFANTTNKPNTIWASQTDDLDNFKMGDAASDAFTITLAASEQNGIAWMENMRRLHAVTATRNYSIRGGEGDGTPISATNMLVQNENMYGAEPVTPQLMNDAVVYAARKGKRVYEMAYSIERDAYLSNDISLLAPHLLESGVTQIAYFANPDSRVFCVCGDGSMAVFTYLPNERVSAWTKWTLGGGYSFRSVGVLPGADTDALYAIAGNNSTGKFSILRLAQYSDKKADGQFLDMAVEITSGIDSGGANASLLHVADGGTVDCVIDGRYIRGCSYANSRITFSEKVENPVRCVAGFSYKGEIETMRMDVLLQSGPTAGMIRRIHNVTASFHSTVSCKAGRRDDIMDVDFRNTRDRMDDTNPEFTGDVTIAWPMGSSRDERVRIVQDQPFPCTVLGISIDWEATGG